jgi:hypothetical protein
MKVIHLINNTYQVVSEDETTFYFQGSIEECETFIQRTEIKGFFITIIIVIIVTSLVLTNI